MGNRRITIAAAVNDRAILAQCLAKSPDVQSGVLPLRTYDGFSSASQAYNRAIAEADADVILFVHQDVYLPHGYHDRVQRALDQLDELAPDWAIAGVVGASADRRTQGKSWSTGLNSLVLGTDPLPAPVATLDEMLIILRVESGLRFDEKLPGFHLYAADIIELAKDAGRSTWVIDAPAVHHSRPVTSLRGSYSQAWHYMRRKWRDRLPIMNLVCPLTPSRISLWKAAYAVWRKHRGRSERMQPQSDPAEIAARLGFNA